MQKRRPELSYTPLERLDVDSPVDRIGWIAEKCRGKVVLDVGCLDETALGKCGTGHWLHERISQLAHRVIGVDNSSRLPEGGWITGPSSRILKGDLFELGSQAGDYSEVQVVVAGELIEHLPDALGFLMRLRALLPGRELIATTPNATSLANVLLAFVNRESMHRDHLQVYSFKTLATLCSRAGLSSWTIRPYHVYFTEMALRAHGVRRTLVRASEKAIHGAERLFPLLSGGLILHVPAL
jgi:SAM-dependent methyltransferase